MGSEKITVGFTATSFKENEQRVPLHPADLCKIDPETRKYVYVEKGYGKDFRVRDEEMAPYVAGLMTREELFENCDAITVFKPTEGDFPYLREGQILWGGLHLVQGPALTQQAIDKKLVGIAMESMFTWRPAGKQGVWIYHTQSEFAGYCSVLHSLQLLGTKGWHDQPKKVAVLCFGGAGRGAVHAFKAMDYADITVYTGRPPADVKCLIPGVKHRQFVRDAGDPSRVSTVADDGTKIPMGEELAQHDFIANCILQDTDNPVTFIHNDDVPSLKNGSLIVDISCDHGMGFEFARPTSFDEPLMEIGQRTLYYAVDHSPSYLFAAASLELSKATLPYIKDLVGGRAAWEANPTIGRAIEIDRGVVLNEKILTFQNRATSYPHEITDS